MKIRLEEAGLFRADEQTDRYDAANISLFAILRTRLKASKTNGDQ